MLIDNFATIFESGSTLIKCRVALMLGYYVDSIFQQSHDAFVKAIEFLVKGVAMEDTDKALALQCSDTLKTAIADQDVVDRVEAFINRLFPYLSEMVTKLRLPTFFDILMGVLKNYATAIDGPSLIRLMDSLVLRIEVEFKALLAKGEKNNMVMSQCWNVIRAICETDAFMPEYADPIERALLPMFNYLVDPTKVEFDDDLIQIITTLIKKRRGVSENMARIFPYLQKFFEKNKGVFGNLLFTLNCYLFFGKDLFIHNKEWIEMTLRLVQTSLFLTQQQIEINNTEGAILCQIVLQTLGNGALDPYIPNILALLLKRLETEPKADFLTRHIYNAILCSVCNNAKLALATLGARLDDIVAGILDIARTYKEVYERKVLVIGLANILVRAESATFASKFFPKILETIITCLQQQKMDETRKRIRADKKAIDDGEGEKSSSSDESDGEEEKEKATPTPTSVAGTGVGPDETMGKMEEEEVKGQSKYCLQNQHYRKKMSNDEEDSEEENFPGMDPLDSVFGIGFDPRIDKPDDRADPGPDQED
ncbi:MAG: hypothetical protein P4M11_07195 [Candidatus Pacebacteria bacterium]|nr:hypothetical protein [Candidatus Paceibacterota bacterium]